MKLDQIEKVNLVSVKKYLVILPEKVIHLSCNDLESVWQYLGICHKKEAYQGVSIIDVTRQEDSFEKINNLIGGIQDILYENDFNEIMEKLYPEILSDKSYKNEKLEVQVGYSEVPLYEDPLKGYLVILSKDTFFLGVDNPRDVIKFLQDNFKKQMEFGVSVIDVTNEQGIMGLEFNRNATNNLIRDIRKLLFK